MSSEKDERIRRVISASSFGEFADGWILCDTDFKVLSVSDVKRGTAWSVKVGYDTSSVPVGIVRGAHNFN